jgi:hypothetical protein
MALGVVNFMAWLFPEAMSTIPHTRVVYGSINHPVTVGGADRRLFFVVLVVGSAPSHLCGSLLGVVIMEAAACGPTHQPVWVTD